MIFIVTIQSKKVLIINEYDCEFSLDAINDALDDFENELLMEKGSFSITCKVKGEQDV